VKHQRNLCDPDLTKLPVRDPRFENFHAEVKSPLNFDKMLEAARRLSEDADFRVDLYNIEGRIAFGELTNHPADGLGMHDPLNGT